MERAQSYQANTDNSGKPTVAIAIMGATGSGKTTFINAASGGSLRIGKSLRSCTSAVQLSPMFTLAGREVILIDTPGFDDTNKSDYDILKMIAAFLATTYEEGHKLTGVIYLHRISDLRMGGIARRNFNMFKELCGESSLKNVAIVTNMWGQMKRHQKEMRELQEQTEAAIKAKDEQTRKELEIETTKLKTEMTRIENESNSLVSGYMAQKAELERQMEVARQAAEAERVEQQRRVEELHRMLQENRNASNAVREQQQRHLNEARARLNRPPRGFWGRLAGAVGHVVVWSAVGLGGSGALLLGVTQFLRG
ncbi:hypothetical protein L218DRAFT_947600 [Marasmius fiardii PR-910]|nr:hypothetical protein L218DRAFT_947600 [Marasmius fiardii PR-910]